jgi:nucleotide-binding universal stress UspA family protein
MGMTEMSFRRIVAGVDGGPSGRDALAFGALLAEVCGATLVAAHVVEEEHLWSEYDHEGQFELRHELFDIRKEAVSVFDRLGRNRGEFAAVPARNVPTGLGEVAESSGADLLVVGSTHRGPIGRVLVGSTGTRLLQGACCSLAVAPRGYADSPSQRRGAVGVGVDGSASSHTAVAVAGRLADRLGCRVVAIGVATGRPPHRQSDGDREVSVHVCIEDALARAELPEAERVVTSGEPAAQLAACACDLDALVVGSRSGIPVGRVLGGSVSRHLMRICPTPVLVAPERISAEKAIV